LDFKGFAGINGWLSPLASGLLFPMAMTVPSSRSRPLGPPHQGGQSALLDGRSFERQGKLEEAAGCYERVVNGDPSGQSPLAIEALRRLGILCHRRNEPARARSHCRQSLEAATAIHNDFLAAEALNALAGFEFESGDIESARQRFLAALELGRSSEELQGRILQNLGILANVEGDLQTARHHYLNSLQAFVHAGDERGCAIAYHNLGMISTDQKQWEEADRYFVASHAGATSLGDVHLQGLCLLNHAEVHLARQRFERARDSAEAALRIFDQLGARLDKAGAYKVLGAIYRETGHHAVAESRLRAAMELALETGSVLGEAEASREMALVLQALGRNQDALRTLNASFRLFNRLNARVDLVDIRGKVAELEGTFLKVVADWGQSIESTDRYTYGHCGRVAEYGIRVAQGLGLSEEEQTTLRLGAYLHDVGKVKVPHEILNKPGRLSEEEFEVVKMHPVWGLELLAAVEFPWDIKPIIRWHHERYDGTGYPDRLKGDEIPLHAQVICIVDVYDALTTTRSYRAALSRDAALPIMAESRHWWRDDVYQAFLDSVGTG
jgi:putative nucleotidyltransferase with HDIG domain